MSAQQLQTPRDPWTRRAFGLIALLAVARVCATWRSELTDTEAYYVGWARWPALSYYDHPPLVAWTTWLVSHVGRSAFVLRLVPSASLAACALLVHRLAARMFSPRASFLATALVSALPVFLGLGMVVNPEAILAPLWMLVLIALYDLRERDEWWRPLSLGAAIGVAFLAKYTALLAVPLAVSWVASSRDTRRWLRRPSFWASGFVALAIASPVIVWNAQRGFPSVTLHLVERVAHPSLSTYAENAARMLLSQMSLIHPLAFPGLLVVAAVCLVRSRNDARFRFLAWVSVPILGFFFVMMVRVRDAEPHWTMVGYVPLAIAMAALLDGAFERWPARAYFGAVTAATAIGFGVFLVHMSSPVVMQLVPHYDPNADDANETFGWDRIARSIERSAAALGEGTVVASDHNVLCGHLEYALDDSPRVYCASERRTQFDFVGRRDVPPDAPVVYVDSARYPREPSTVLGGRSCSLDRRVDVARGGRVVQSVRIWSCPIDRERGREQQANR